LSPAATLAPDAAMALGIAATAMPFAPNRAGEAERWLRVLRSHGEAGIALQALGVSEGPAEGDGHGHEHDAGDTAPPGVVAPPGVAAPAGEADPARVAEDSARDSIAQVAARAAEIAGRRGVAGVGTIDLLLAVIEIYGEQFDRALRAHGTDREEVLARLGEGDPSEPSEPSPLDDPRR
jgi:hypothetical protein